MSRHFTHSRKYNKGNRCKDGHNWIPIRPLHIKCTVCRITAVRSPSMAERREMKAGNWIILGARRG